MVAFNSKSGALRSVRKITNSISILIITIIAVFVILNIAGVAKSASDFIIHPSLIAATIICMWVNGARLRDIGLSTKFMSFPAITLGLMMGALSIGTIFWAMVLNGELQFDLIHFVNAFGINSVKLLLFYTMVAVGEELFFRGYLIGVLRKGMKPWSAVMISAVLFTALHLMNPKFNLMAFVDVFLIGILLGYLFLKTKSLLPCIGFHLVWNFLQDTLNFPDKGGEMITGLVIGVNLLVIYCMHLYQKRKRMNHLIQQPAT